MIPRSGAPQGGMGHGAMDPVVLFVRSMYERMYDVDTYADEMASH